MTVRTAERLVRVHKNTAAYYYHRLQEIIYRAIADATPLPGRLKSIKVILAGAQRQARSRSGGQGAGLWLVKTGRKALCDGHHQR